MKTLSDRERLFAEEYVINKGNALQAALKAGYTESTAKHATDWLRDEMPDEKGRKFKRKPQLRKYIDDMIQKQESNRVASPEEVLQYLTAVMRKETQAHELVVVGTGDGCSEAQVVPKPPSEKEALDAAKALAKIMGVSTNRQKAEQDLRIRKLELEVERLTEEPDETTATNFIDALTNEAGDVWEE